jgi:hypothetical protein
MARGRQLSQLLDALQAEAGMSLLPASATSSKDHRIQLLNRVQDRLYKAFDWDFAFVKRDVAVTAGNRILNLPTDLELERINEAWISNGPDGNDWRPLGFGIGEAQYRSIQENERGMPQTWSPAEDDKFEIWPSADASYRVRFRGAKRLPLMVNPSDRAVLDDTLIVLFAASEMMKRQKLLDSEDKLREATLHFTRLRAMNGGTKRSPFVMGGGTSGLVGDAHRRPVQGLDYIP